MDAVHLFLGSAAIVSAIAAWYDYRTGHIPNVVTLAPLGGALLAHFVVGAKSQGLYLGAQELGFSILGALACAFIPLVLYRAGAIGGGDVKLLAAIGALCRTMLGVEAEFYAFIAAAIFAPARLAWEGKLWRTLGNTVTLAANPFRKKANRREIAPEMMTSLRFGPAVFVGVLVMCVLHWRGGSP